MGFQNFFATKLFNDIGASDTAITLETPPSVTSGRLTLEARNATQREIVSYTGVSGNQVTGVTRGIGGTLAKAHVKNALVEMNAVGEDLSDLYTAFNTFSVAASNGWLASAATFSVATGYNKGNKEYEVTTSTDLRALLAPGMRFKATRGTVPPTQCADLEQSSSQFASRATGSVVGISFTDDFTCEGWAKMESNGGCIVSRYDGSTAGWILTIESTGQPRLYADGAAIGDYRCHQSLPIGQWVHVAATADLSAGQVLFYINGVAAPSYVFTGGTTAIVQAGNLQVGAFNSSAPFDGKLADVRVWSTVRTLTQIRDNMNQQLTGSETGLVGYWKLNGDFNDSTANANHLTASGGAVATNLDNPMKPIEYGIIHKVTATTVTVFTGTEHNIPNMSLTLPHYSTHRTPYGFPSDGNKWVVESLMRNNMALGVAALSVWYESGLRITAGIGEWRLTMSLPYAAGYSSATGTGNMNEVYYATALIGTPSLYIRNLIMRDANNSTTLTTAAVVSGSQSTSLSVTTSNTYVVGYMMPQYTGGGASAGINGTSGEASLRLESAYV